MILITLFYYLILKTDGYGIAMTESQFEVERAPEDVRVKFRRLSTGTDYLDSQRDRSQESG